MRLLALLLLLLTAPAAAEDYYCVSTTGTKTTGVSTTDIEGFAWGDSDCYGDPQDAADEMVAGDQLWIADGSYTEAGADYWIDISDLDGSSGDYTIVRALDPGEVSLTSSTGGGVLVRRSSYVQVIGLHIAEVNDEYTAITVGGTGVDQGDASDHVLVKRCSWAMDSGLTINSSSYVTWEDCFVYGGPLRYPFQVGTSSELDLTSNIVFRRCLVRWDYSNVGEPLACFATYNSEYIAYQNCVTVDGTDWVGIDDTQDGSKAFFTPNSSRYVYYDGCMIVNMTGFAGILLEGSVGVTAWADNCLIWGLRTGCNDATDTYDPWTIATTTSTGSFTVTNCTFGINDCVDCSGASIFPLNFGASSTNTMRNCIVYGQETDPGYYAVTNDVDDGDYNLYYANTGNRDIEGGGYGANDITGTDPLTSGLFYKTEIMPCSYLQTVGEAGGRIGAQIRTKIGEDGTFWGDTGWNSDTGKPLWPFPYEDQIRSRCEAFHMDAEEAYTGSPEMDGARGFCSGEETLTSWLLKGGE